MLTAIPCLECTGDKRVIGHAFCPSHSLGKDKRVIDREGTRTQKGSVSQRVQKEQLAAAKTASLQSAATSVHGCSLMSPCARQLMLLEACPGSPSSGAQPGTATRSSASVRTSGHDAPPFLGMR